jgi:hypothetical protein
MMVGPTSLLESRGSVLEELLLPAVEHRRLESQFVNIDPRSALLPPNAASEWQPSLPPCSASVVSSCVRSVILTEERFLHFQLRQDNARKRLLAQENGFLRIFRITERDDWRRDSAAIW